MQSKLSLVKSTELNGSVLFLTVALMAGKKPLLILKLENGKFIQSTWFYKKPKTIGGQFIELAINPLEFDFKTLSIGELYLAYKQAEKAYYNGNLELKRKMIAYHEKQMSKYMDETYF